MEIKEITKTRYEALSYGRMPFAKEVGKEIKWFATKEDKLLGILIYDIPDKDYSYVVLARDSDHIFKAISLRTSISSKKEAIKKLHESLIEEAQNSDESYYQDELKEKFNIFEEKTSKDKQHPHFKTLINSLAYSPAKKLIEEMVYAFKDPDGNYIEQFQTTGFNSRLWELALFGYFHENDFLINKNFNSPDFNISKYRQYAIEAVTVNPSLTSDIPEKPTTQEDIQKLISDFMPIRFGSTLFTKLKKKYWEKDHVKGNPFIIAIHDFHYDDSMTWSRPALERYLYGMEPVTGFDNNGNLKVTFNAVKEHCWQTKKIPSNFFKQPDTENISAILFSNQATVAKFNRMGFLAEFGSKKVRMIREVLLYDPDPNAVIPKRLFKKVELENYTEFWREGLIMYHNPNAIYPIDPDEFPEISHAKFENGQWINLLHDDYPFSSSTIIHMLNE